MQEQFSKQLAQAIYQSLGDSYGVKTVHGSNNERLSVDDYEKGNYRESASMLKLHIEEGWYFEPQVFPPSALAYLIKHYIADKNIKEQQTIGYILNWSLSDTVKLFKSSRINDNLALSILNNTYVDKFSIKPEEKTDEDTLKQSYIFNLCLLVSQVSNRFHDESHTEALAHYLSQRQNEIKDHEYMIHLCEALVLHYPHELKKFQALEIVKNHLEARTHNEFELEEVENVWTIKLDLKKVQHIFLLPLWTVKEYAYVMQMLMQEIEENGIANNKGVEDVLMQNKYDEAHEYQYSLITVNQTLDSQFSREDLLGIIKTTFDYLKDHNRLFSLSPYNDSHEEQKKQISQDLEEIVKKIMFYQTLNQNLKPYDDNEHYEDSPTAGKLKI